MSNVPPKNTKTWKKNETIINNNPVLKQARDIQQGLEKPAGHYKQTHGGKGSAPRVDTNSAQYGDNFDKIFKQGKYKKSDD